MSCFLDTSFIVDGLAQVPECITILQAARSCQLFINDLVCAEAIHVLAHAYFREDVQNLLLGTNRYVSRSAALKLRATMQNQLKGEINKNVNYNGIWHACEKHGDAAIRSLIHPYYSEPHLNLGRDFLLHREGPPPGQPRKLPFAHEPKR